MTWTDKLLAFGRDERVLLVCIGLATFGVVSTMMTALTLIRDDSEIPRSEPKTEYITQETEDSLALETLDKLVDHPNYSIRRVALRIVCDRAANDTETIDYLLRGITCPEYAFRLKCLRALSLLTQQTAGYDGIEKLHKPYAYAAIVRSLEFSLGDADRPPLRDAFWDEYYLRDSAEKLCLKFLQELVFKHNAHLLIQAKFIEKWLSKQDWGDMPEDILENFKSYSETKDNKISYLIRRIQNSRRGLKALERCGLVNKANTATTHDIPDLMVDEFIGDVPLERQPRRDREHSAEERRLRRQHREAMVLNDGTRPLAREDIIERGHNSPA